MLLCPVGPCQCASHIFNNELVTRSHSCICIAKANSFHPTLAYTEPHKKPYTDTGRTLQWRPGSSLLCSQINKFWQFSVKCQNGTTRDAEVKAKLKALQTERTWYSASPEVAMQTLRYCVRRYWYGKANCGYMYAYAGRRR